MNAAVASRTTDTISMPRCRGRLARAPISAQAVTEPGQAVNTVFTANRSAKPCPSDAMPRRRSALSVRLVAAASAAEPGQAVSFALTPNRPTKPCPINDMLVPVRRSAWTPVAAEFDSDTELGKISAGPTGPAAQLAALRCPGCLRRPGPAVSVRPRRGSRMLLSMCILRSKPLA
jgi:hypothetical protein